jgi:hypothetical protein
MRLVLKRYKLHECHKRLGVAMLSGMTEQVFGPLSLGLIELPVLIV